MSEEPTSVDPEAEAVRRRLSSLPFARPCDRPRVEPAIGDYLRALGLEPRPVRWIEADTPDGAARDGFLAAWAAKYRRGRPEAPGFTRTEAHYALRGTGLRAKALIGPALEAEKAAGRSVRRAARKAPFGGGDLDDGGRAKLRNITVVSAASGLSRARDAARAAFSERGTVEKAGIVTSQYQAEAKHLQAIAALEAEVQVGAAPAQALEAANWLARAAVLRAAGRPTEAHERLAAAFLPLVDAAEAGLWLFWVMKDAVIAVPAPPG
jgi:hypothetical protein